MNYDEKLSDLSNMIDSIEKIYTSICRTDYREADNMLSDKVTKIVEMMTEFMQNGKLFKNYDIDVPQEVILAQLQNLLEAYENKDYVMLSDTLHYEVTDSLNFYSEILQEFKKENIQI